MARKRKTNPVSPRLILLAGGAALIGTIAVVAVAKERKRKKLAEEKKKKELEGGGSTGGSAKEGKGGKKKMPPSDPLPNDAGAGYLYPGTTPPADFDSTKIWLSSDCRSWLIGKDYIPGVDGLAPASWWSQNAAPLEEYNLATDGLSALSISSSPNAYGDVTPDVRFLYTLIEALSPSCAQKLPKMDGFAAQVGTTTQQFQKANKDYQDAIQFTMDDNPSFYDFANTLLGLIQEGTFDRIWGIDPDAGQTPWSMYSAVAAATGEGIDFNA